LGKTQIQMRFYKLLWVAKTQLDL